MEQLKYTIAPRGRNWAVLEWQYLPNGSTATVFNLYNSKMEAERVKNMLLNGQSV